MDAELRRKLAIHEGPHLALIALLGKKPIGSSLGPGRGYGASDYERPAGERINDPAEIFKLAVICAAGEVGEHMLGGGILEGADRDGEGSDRARIDECSNVLVNHLGRDQAYWRDAAYLCAARLITENLPLVVAIVAELKQSTFVDGEHWAVVALQAKAQKNLSWGGGRRATPPTGQPAESAAGRLFNSTKRKEQKMTPETTATCERYAHIHAAADGRGKILKTLTEKGPKHIADFMEAPHDKYLLADLGWLANTRLAVLDADGLTYRPTPKGFQAMGIDPPAADAPPADLDDDNDAPPAALAYKPRPTPPTDIAALARRIVRSLEDGEAATIATISSVLEVTEADACAAIAALRRGGDVQGRTILAGEQAGEQGFELALNGKILRDALEEDANENPDREMIALHKKFQREQR